jgi:hypothetical protein
MTQARPNGFVEYKGHTRHLSAERSEESRSARLAITRLLAFFRQDARLVLTGKGGK